MRARTAKAQLNTLACDVYASILNMTPRQRSAALRALAGLTPTNCSWQVYEMRFVLRGFIDTASSFTEAKRRKRLDARRGQ